MHAIDFEAAAISTQSDPPGTLLRPPIPPFMFVLGPSRGSPEASAQHQTISISVAPSSHLHPITNTCSAPTWHPQEPSPPPSSAAGYHSEALRNAGHVVEHDAQKEDQDTGHQDHSAHARPGGAFHHAPPVWLLLHRLLGSPALQGLLLGGDGHHGDRLLLAPGQQAAAHVSRQQRSLLGDGQGQHVAPIAGKFDEDGGVLRGVRDGNDREDLGVVGEL